MEYAYNPSLEQSTQRYEAAGKTWSGDITQGRDQAGRLIVLVLPDHYIACISIFNLFMYTYILIYHGITRTN